MRFSSREDFCIIAAARSEDETEIRAGKAAGGRRDPGHSARDASTLLAEEKIRIVLEGLRGRRSRRGPAGIARGQESGPGRRRAGRGRRGRSKDRGYVPIFWGRHSCRRCPKWSQATIWVIGLSTTTSGGGDVCSIRAASRRPDHKMSTLSESVWKRESPSGAESSRSDRAGHFRAFRQRPVVGAINSEEYRGSEARVSFAQTAAIPDEGR